MDSRQFTDSDLEHILGRLERIEHILRGDLAIGGLGSVRLRDELLPWIVAARACGKSIKQVRDLVWRERRRPNGMQLRVARGGVHRRDFEKFLETRYARKPGRGGEIRRAIRDLEKEH